MKNSLYREIQAYTKKGWEVAPFFSFREPFVMSPDANIYHEDVLEQQSTDGEISEAKSLIGLLRTVNY